MALVEEYDVVVVDLVVVPTAAAFQTDLPHEGQAGLNYAFLADLRLLALVVQSVSVQMS